jgi:hypothetical protein
LYRQGRAARRYRAAGFDAAHRRGGEVMEREGIGNMNALRDPSRKFT